MRAQIIEAYAMTTITFARTQGWELLTPIELADQRGDRPSEFGNRYS